MRLEAYQHGIYPRSERLVRATRDLDRGRTDDATVEAEYRRDRNELVAVQRDAGLDYVYDGQLPWQDHFRPFVEHCEGLATGPLTRWFDTNSFFRAPVVTGALSVEAAAVPVADVTGPEPVVACLPSPYAFSRAAQFDGDRDVFMLDLAREVLGPVAAHAVTKGATLLHLEDPWLAYFGPDGDVWSTLGKSIDEMRGDLDVTVVFHTYFGDVAPFIGELQGLPVDAVGFDLSITDTDELRPGGGKAYLLGCFDGRNSVVERPEEIVRAVSRLLDRLEPPACFLSSSGDLQLVSEQLARRKVAALGEAAAALKEAIA